MSADVSISVRGCSKWYGRVVGLLDVTWEPAPGVVGLLGSNGSGKTTLMKLLAGLIAPSRGTALVCGAVPFEDTEVRGRIGYAPEHDETWDEMTVKELVSWFAVLAGVSHPRVRPSVEAALEQVGMQEHRDRLAGSLSKGMRQRTKLASAIAHDPAVLLLDEPLAGVDPIARIGIVDAIRRFAEGGKLVCISSHVLYEIEALTTQIAVIDRGRLLADGDIAQLRTQLRRRPTRLRIVCDQPRELASTLARLDHVERVDFEDGGLDVYTCDPDRCCEDIASAVRASSMVVSALLAPDGDLDTIVDALTARDQT